jgi:CBS domain-containing protein
VVVPHEHRPQHWSATVTPDIVQLSEIVRRPLIDEQGDRIGRVEDVVVRLGANPHPPVVGLVVRFGGRELFVASDKIGSLDEGKVRFAGKRVDLRRFERREGELLLAKDLLSRHLINIGVGRLITANNILLAQGESSWEVVGVDPKRPSIFGRLGGRRSPSSEVVDFASIEPFVAHVPSAKLQLTYRKLAKLHPAQIADLVEAASHEEGEEIIDAVGEDQELEADVFEELDMEHQVEFLATRSDREVARLLERMASDDAADLISEIPQERRLLVLDQLPEAQQRKVRSLLSYNPETAGGIMTPDFVAVLSTATVADAIAAVAASTAPPEALNVVYSLNADGSLQGSAPLASLVRSPASAMVIDVAQADPASVKAGWDLHRVARQMSDFNLVVAPVVDREDGHVVGVVTIDDLIELLLPQGWRREFGMSTVEE